MSNEKKMPRVLFGVLASTVPLVCWYLWRRSGLRQKQANDEPAPPSHVLLSSDEADAVAVTVNDSSRDALSSDIEVTPQFESAPCSDRELVGAVPAECVVVVHNESEEVDSDPDDGRPASSCPVEDEKLVPATQLPENNLDDQDSHENLRGEPIHTGFSDVPVPHVAAGSCESAITDSANATLETPVASTVAEHDSQESPFIPQTETSQASVDSFARAELQPIIEQSAEQSPDQVETVEETTERIPQRYRPPVQRPPRTTPARPKSEEAATSSSVSMPLDIRIRITFDRVGYCQLGFLPERNATLDNEVMVRGAGTPIMLVAQEDWYEDIHLSNIGDYLRQGLELKGALADGRRVRWLLTGRDLYVLASHPSASGYVSTNRVVLGRSHIVMCGTEILAEVETILKEAGCLDYRQLSASDGIPSGWTGLRDVSPRTPIPLQSDDPFYAIKPAPDIEIEIEGGISLGVSTWLEGFPPQIKLLGEYNGTVNVLIDGQTAELTPNGFLKGDTSEQVGQHTVYCEGLTRSRTYSIKEPPDSWEEWAAFRFGSAQICGPLVRVESGTVATSLVTIPQSNPLLLGAHPGQIFRCSFRRGSRWKGYVPFDVVWALPATPLISDKRVARILSVGDSAPKPAESSPKPTKQVLDWCTAILDASRKGLSVESELPDAAACWSQYKKVARSIWRAAR